MYNIQFILMVQKIQGFQRFPHIPNIAILPLPPSGHAQPNSACDILQYLVLRQLCMISYVSIIRPV